MDLRWIFDGCALDARSMVVQCSIGVRRIWERYASEFVRVSVYWIRQNVGMLSDMSTCGRHVAGYVKMLSTCHQNPVEYITYLNTCQICQNVVSSDWIHICDRYSIDMFDRYSLYVR